MVKLYQLQRNIGIIQVKDNYSTCVYDMLVMLYDMCLLNENNVSSFRKIENDI